MTPTDHQTMSDAHDGHYEELRRTSAAMLGLDPDAALSAADMLIVKDVMALRVQLDQYDDDQARGLSINVVERSKVSERLHEILLGATEEEETEAAGAVRGLDLSRYSDSELGILEAAMQITAGTWDAANAFDPRGIEHKLTIERLEGELAEERESHLRTRGCMTRAREEVARLEKELASYRLAAWKQQQQRPPGGGGDLGGIQ